MSSAVQGKTVFIPRMCDHALAAGAALRAMGTDAEVLPPPDDETLGIGLNLCAGRECSPCFTCTGDIIRRAREPGFDPAASSLPCYRLPFSMHHRTVTLKWRTFCAEPLRQKRVP